VRLEFEYQASDVGRPSLQDDVTAVSRPVPCSLYPRTHKAVLRILLRNKSLYIWYRLNTAPARAFANYTGRSQHVGLKGLLNDPFCVSAILRFCEWLTTPRSSMIYCVAAPPYNRNRCIVCVIVVTARLNKYCHCHSDMQSTKCNYVIK